MSVVHTYTRWSDDDQEAGRSLGRQGEGAAQFIENGKHRKGHTYIDPGRSGFRGDKQKDLKRFLQDIKEGSVQPGDIVFIEAIDRLSRKGIRPTQKLVISILEAGVSIAISFPIAKVYRADQDTIGDAIELAAFAYQARLYSELLSNRIKDSWATMRKGARSGKKSVSNKIPAWLDTSMSIIQRIKNWLRPEPKRSVYSLPFSSPLIYTPSPRNRRNRRDYFR